VLLQRSSPTWVGSMATDATRNVYAVAAVIASREAWDEPQRHGGWISHSENRPLEFSYRGTRALMQLVRRAWEDAVSSRSVEGAIGAAQAAFGTPRIATQNIHKRLAGNDEKLKLADPARIVGIELQHQTAEGLDLVMIRLLGHEPELYAAVDRLRGERDLRLALAFSCVVLTTFFLIEGPWWACVASALLVPLLVAQAIGRRRAAGDQLIDALSIRRVQAPTLERFLQLSGVAWADAGRGTVPSDPEQSE